MRTARGSNWQGLCLGAVWLVGLLGSGATPAQSLEIPVVPGQRTYVGSTDYACELSTKPVEPTGDKGQLSAVREDHPSSVCRLPAGEFSYVETQAYRLNYYYTMRSDSCGQDRVSFTETRTTCAPTSYGFSCLSTPSISSTARTYNFDTPSIVAPQARDDAATVAANSTGNAIPVTANDVNAAGASLTLPSSSSTRGGTLAVSRAGLTYSPPAGYSGQDSFTYQLANCAGTSRATVTVTVGALPPVAQNLLLEVSPNQPTTIDLGPYVQNATGIQILVGPRLGTATVSGLRVTYTPGAQFTTRDDFIYQAVGPGGTSVSATVALVARTGPPTAPVAQDAQAEVSPTGFTSIDLSPYVQNATSVQITTAPGLGTATVSGWRITYTPGSQFVSRDSLRYQAQGPGGASAPATLTLVARPAASGPVAQDAQVNVSPGGPTTIDMSPFVREATGVRVLTSPRLGTATVVGLRVTYNPGNQFATRDSLSYQAIGPSGGSAPATLTLVGGALNSGLVVQGEVFRYQTRHLTNSINRRISQLLAPRVKSGPSGDSGAAPAQTGWAEPGGSGHRVPGAIGGANALGARGPGAADEDTLDNGRLSRPRSGSEGLGLLASALGMGSGLSLSSDQASLDLPMGWLGLAGGDQPGSWGGWGNLAYTRLENELATSRYDGRLYSLIGGADYRLTDDLWLGAALAYETSRIDTDFNEGEAKNDGFVFTPYLAYTFFRGDDSSAGVSLMAGYGALDHSTLRHLGGAPITGSFNADRWLVEADVKGFKTLDRWTLQGFGGYLWADQEAGAFLESDGTAWSKRTFRLREFKLGGEAAYRLTDEFEPYLRATYYHNAGGTNLHLGFDPTDEVDHELELLLGFNWTPRPDTTASLEIGRGFFNGDLDRTSAMFNLKMEF